MTRLLATTDGTPIIPANALSGGLHDIIAGIFKNDVRIHTAFGRQWHAGIIARWLVVLWALFLSACAGTANFQPINAEGMTPALMQRPLIDRPDETLVAMAFSGGGMRASAFSYGVLKSLEKTPSPDGPLTEKVDFIGGVSGGSVTAAYFALKGPAHYGDFRHDFLDQNAEGGLNSEMSISNVARILTFGGVNDRSSFPTWLDQHVFDEATYADVLNKRPILWIVASDVFNRRPFIFSPETFAPLCSDLSKIKLSGAVAASAAVPGAFTPINIESFADHCDWQEPAWSGNTDLYFTQQMQLDAYRRYRDTKNLKYIKLVDGGLTDNFGLQGIAMARLSQGEAYAPLSKKRALLLKHLLFIMVDSGRGPGRGEWNMRPDIPSIFNLASAITDAAIDANVHVTYDFFDVVMREWERQLVEWRCGLPEVEKAALRHKQPGWRCDGVQFHVAKIGFSDAGEERRVKLDVIPTRFVLPKEDIDFLIESADVALQQNPVFRKFKHELVSPPLSR